jgi:transposase
MVAPESIMYTRKIRFYPGPEQKALFNKCLGASRFFYNRTVALINKRARKQKGSFKGLLDYKKIRRLVSQPDKELSEHSHMAWQKQIPYDTRDQAVKDACQAFKSSFALKKAKHITHFNVKFRSKKQGAQSFRVNPDALTNDLRIFQTRLKKHSRIRVRKRNLDDLLNHGNPATMFFSILRTKSDKWYLCLPREKEPPVYENAVYKSVFLDPGVRTFQTFYSPDGVCGKLGDGFAKALEPLAQRHDKLWSQASSNTELASYKTRRHMRTRCAKIRDKIKNKVRDMHCHSCNFLCTTFRNIFIPAFEVSNMVEGSPLGSSITRSMLQLSHFAFRERLTWYAKTKHRNVFIVGEAYTTKTCGSCGNEQQMECKVVYACDCCGAKIDRDYNGARNICLSVMTALT